MIKALALAVAACFLVSSCGSDEPRSDPDADASRPTLQGTFSAEFGVRTTVRGTEVPGTAITVTWVARSTCGAAGCVATATEFPATPQGDPRPPTMVFDFVDGRWVSVAALRAQCSDAKGLPIDVESWQAFTLEPQPDGTLVGNYTNRSSVAGACFSSTQTLTVKRTGDLDPKAKVADPGAQPARVASPAAGLWGSYRLVQTNPDTGQVYPPTTYAGNTHCLRTGDRCLSYLVDPQSDALLVMTFAKDQWTSTSAPAQTPCGNGKTASSVIIGQMALPKPASDPITVVDGSQRTQVTGACPTTLSLAARMERTGDAPGRV